MHQHFFAYPKPPLRFHAPHPLFGSKDCVCTLLSAGCVHQRSRAVHRPTTLDHVVRLVMTLLYYPTCHDPSRTNLDRGHQPEATCRAVSRAHALHGPERHPQPAKLLALTRKPAVVEERAG